MGAFPTKRRVEFADTDAAGITHFASFFRFMEEAEHEMLRSAGIGVLHHEVGDLIVSWPRVAARCDYVSPAHFEDVLEVTIWVSRLGSKSATYTAEFRRGETLIARGETTAACCIVGDDGGPQAIEIPPPLRSGLGQFLQESPPTAP